MGLVSTSPSRGCRVRKAAVALVVCFECGGIWLRYFSFLFFEHTRPAASLELPWPIYLSATVATPILADFEVANIGVPDTALGAVYGHPCGPAIGYPSRYITADIART